tara:strand:+ start:450 stop:1994 length:1545 start_codon:yes stop_codon:yes gene_type:complete
VAGVERSQLADIIDDPDEFISRLCIMHKKRQRLARFELNKAQEILLDTLKSHNRIIVLKARQLGISTLTRAWNFWQAYTADQPRQFAVISHTRSSAEELHRIEKTFYHNLPKPLRRPLSKSSARTIQFENTGAELKTYTAGGKGGTRSFAMHSAHLSEFAFYENQEETMATVMAAVGEGQVVIESTPNVYGDMFHTLCEGAIAGTNEWKLVFFPWHINESYAGTPPDHFILTGRELKVIDKLELTKDQMWWRRKQVRTLGASKFQREYPATVEECFSASGAYFFDPERLAEIEPMDLGSHEHRLYCDPVEGDRYVIGVDVGAGIGKKGDYSVVTVVSVSTRQPVYHYIDNACSPSKLAEKIVPIWEKYNRGKIIVEANNIGIWVIYRLKELRVRNLFLEDGKDFRTTVRTRPMMFAALKDMVEQGMIQRLCKNVLKELGIIIYINDKPQAPRGSHDDVTMSLCLCYYALLKQPLAVTSSLRKALMDEHIKKRRVEKMKRTIPWNVTGGNDKGTY